MGLEPLREILRAPSEARLSDDISESILRLIVDESLEEGARLPSERDLAERFDTSRLTVSQALRRLSLLGMVDIRRGSGVYVLRRPQAMVTTSLGLMLDLDRDSIHDLMQARLWLETMAVEHAASLSDGPDDIAAKSLADDLERLVASHGSTPRWIAADAVFHVAVVDLAKNSFISAFYQSVHTASLESEYDAWVKQNTEPRWLHATTPEEHRALHEPIMRAVLDHDPEAGREAVAAHHRVMLDHLREALGRDLEH